MKFRITLDADPMSGKFAYSAVSNLGMFSVSTQFNDDVARVDATIVVLPSLLDQLPVVNQTHLLGLFLAHVAGHEVDESGEHDPIPDFEVVK